MAWNRTKLMYRKDDHVEWGGGNTCAHVMSSFVKIGSEMKVDMDEVKLAITDTMYKNDTVMLQEEMQDYAGE